jgi:hypothetical protein
MSILINAIDDYTSNVDNSATHMSLRMLPAARSMIDAALVAAVQ